MIHVEINEEGMCGGGDVCTTDNGPGPDCDGDYVVEEDSGQDQVVLVPIVPSIAVSSWTLRLKFEAPVVDVSSPLAEVTGSDSSWTLTSKDYDGDLETGVEFQLRFHGAQKSCHFRHLFT